MRRLIPFAAMLILSSTLLSIDAVVANADEGAICRRGACEVKATNPGKSVGKKQTSGVGSTTGPSNERSKGGASPTTSSPTGPSAPQSTAAMSRAVAEADYAIQQLGYQRCRSAVAAGTAATDDCIPPVMGSIDPEPAEQGAPVVTITPAQAAAIAVARLELPTVAPGIGPSPELNRWKMAAVGYPLWLWADGPTERGPVNDSAGGVAVSLKAEIASLTFRMGDGRSVECAGHGEEWTRSVTPGAKSPTCGHTYIEPSLPAGSYEVTAVANWAVEWTAGGQTGLIDVPVTSSRQLPVGELQSVITG